MKKRNSILLRNDTGNTKLLNDCFHRIKRLLFKINSRMYKCP